MNVVSLISGRHRRQRVDPFARIGRTIDSLKAVPTPAAVAADAIALEAIIELIRRAVVSQRAGRVLVQYEAAAAPVVATHTDTLETLRLLKEHSLHTYP